ncbi:MAG: acyl-CoA thioesterase domain-containing protein, partial [Mycobacterium sp.]
GHMTTAATTIETAASYFVPAGAEVFVPTAAAGGHWGESLISGPAVAGLAAYALERDYGQPGFLPARFTIDLIKPARQVPTRVQTRLVRDGRRVRFTECDIAQGDWIVARATSVQYRISEAPTGDEWTTRPDFTAPQGADGDGLSVGSDDAGWSAWGPAHQNTSRKRAYSRGVGVIAGVTLSPFVRSVVVAESAANMVINLGRKGIGYINGDLTVSLSRSARGEFIGVQADSRFAADGVSVGTATLFDDAGPIGTAMITALANPAAQIDFAGTARNEAPGAELFTGNRS